MSPLSPDPLLRSIGDSSSDSSSEPAAGRFTGESVGEPAQLDPDRSLGGLPGPSRTSRTRRTLIGLGRAVGRMGWRLNLVMLLLTLASTAIAGGVLFTVPDGPTQGLLDLIAADPLRFFLTGLRYSIPVMLILGSHEMGHYLFCRYYGVEATLPYFIPGPPYFGTFGAVIRMQPPIPGRKALFDIGVAGPIAGFVVAMPVLIYGIATARIESLPPPEGPALSFGDCLLLKLLVGVFRGAVGEGSSLTLNPAMLAGWFGLLVTAMNLFPVGQLDGGHVAFSMSRRLHSVASRATIAAMGALVAATLVSGLAETWSMGEAYGVILGIFVAGAFVLTYLLWRRLDPRFTRVAILAMIALISVCFARGVFTPWMLWTVILVLMGRAGHPPVQSEAEPIGRVRSAVAFAALLILVFCFMPFPIELVGAPG